MSSNKAFSKQVRSDLQKAKRNAEIRTEYARDFTIDEVYLAIRSLKRCKATGVDGIFPEFLQIADLTLSDGYPNFSAKF